jgi:hypothetical protein
MPDAPVSWGELLDKVTILELKAERITASAALANVRRELAALRVVEARAPAAEGLTALRAELAHVNLALWEIEDAIREHEQAGDFGARFVELARSVYRENDRRAAIKRRINQLTGSDLVEEKSYAGAAKDSGGD